MTSARCKIKSSRGCAKKAFGKSPAYCSGPSVKGRAGFDNKAIQQAAVEAGVDLDHFKTLGEPSDRLVITVA